MWFDDANIGTSFHYYFYHYLNSVSTKKYLAKIIFESLIFRKMF
jgi:hypothetical protein